MRNCRQIQRSRCQKCEAVVKTDLVNNHDPESAPAAAVAARICECIREFGFGLPEFANVSRNSASDCQNLRMYQGIWLRIIRICECIKEFGFGFPEFVKFANVSRNLAPELFANVWSPWRHRLSETNVACGMRRRWWQKKKTDSFGMDTSAVTRSLLSIQLLLSLLLLLLSLPSKFWWDSSSG